MIRLVRNNSILCSTQNILTVFRQNFSMQINPMKILNQKEEENDLLVKEKVTNNRIQYHGTGSRKTASARVWLTLGEGKVRINKQPFTDYFPRDYHREEILLPFYTTSTTGFFDAYILVQGGGKSGQAGAIRLGVARALKEFEPEFVPILTKVNLLTRDARKVERKKYGHVKARKVQQWSCR